MGQDLVWETLHEELELCDLNVDVSPTSIGGQPAVVLIAPVARLSACDSLRALLLAKDLELGSVVVSGDCLALRYVMFAIDTSNAAVLVAASVLSQNAARLAPAIAIRKRPLTPIGRAFATS